MKQHHAAAVGVLALGLLWLYARRPLTGTVTTSEGFDLSDYGGPISYPAPIQRLGEAIARAEGFYVAGSIPARAHNPGDLKLPNTETINGITVFASDGAGFTALYKQLWLILVGQSSYYNLDMSIDEMARTWTATQQAEWSANVSNFLGVAPSTPIWEVLS